MTLYLNLKGAEVIVEEFEFQLINYLKRTEKKLGYYWILAKNLSLEERFLKIQGRN